jgi:hypothetical protein
MQQPLTHEDHSLSRAFASSSFRGCRVLLALRAQAIDVSAVLLAAVRVIIVVAGDPAPDALADAIERALRASLGVEAALVVERSHGESDEMLASRATSDHASLLAIVTSSDDQRRMQIRFVQPRDGQWSSRAIQFDPSDAPRERGRTIGFSIAAIVPDEPPSPHLETPSPPPRLALVPSAEHPPPPATDSLRSTMLEAAGHVATGIGGYGGGIGGIFGVRLALWGPFTIRAALGARSGDIGPARATSRIVFGGAGIAWQAWLDASHRWSAGVRLDALVIGHDVVHFDPDDVEPVGRFRLLPGGSVAVEGAWRFASQTAIVAAFGAEVAFGRTDVFTHGLEVASIAPLRALAETGVRVSF